MSACKWRKLLAENDCTVLKQLFKTKTEKELKQQFDCSIDTLHIIRTQLGLGKKRTWFNELVTRFTREQVLEMYLKTYDRRLKDMAAGLDCAPELIVKLLKHHEIEQQPHHPSEYQEVRQAISDKAKERAQIHNPISNILNNPNWNKKSVETRQQNDSYQQPHIKNRKINEYTIDQLIKEVNRYGVWQTAKRLDVTASTLYKIFHDNDIQLVGGPKPYIIETVEYKNRMRQQGIKAYLTIPHFDTSIELALQEELIKRNIKFETQVSLLNLTVPDIFIAPNIVIYADGCWWHCCASCNFNYKNLEARGRDKYVNEGLRRAGYRVFRFWEHDIKKDVKACIDQVVAYMKEKESA